MVNSVEIKYQTELHIIMGTWLLINVNDAKEDTKEKLSTWENSIYQISNHHDYKKAILLYNYIFHNPAAVENSINFAIIHSIIRIK